MKALIKTSVVSAFTAAILLSAPIAAQAFTERDAESSHWISPANFNSVTATGSVTRSNASEPVHLYTEGQPRRQAAGGAPTVGEGSNPAAAPVTGGGSYEVMYTEGDRRSRN